MKAKMIAALATCLVITTGAVAAEDNRSAAEGIPRSPDGGAKSNNGRCDGTDEVRRQCRHPEGRCRTE